MVTLKDIAREAGVSVMTVSRVVNGNFSKVSVENIKKIQAIIEKKHYVPNSTARSLSSKSSRIVSLIVRGRGNELTNPYNATMVGEIVPLIQKQGYYLMLHFTDQYGDITQRLRAWNVEGAIFVGTFDGEIQKIIRDNQIPLIFTDSYSRVRQITNVGVDDYKGGELAAHYLLKNGHKNFAFVGWALASGVVRGRFKGFRETLEKAGYPLDRSHILEVKDSLSDIVSAICGFEEDHVAIFTSADLLAVTLMDRLRERNRIAPRDYSIIGFDDLSIAGCVTPRLTTISQSFPKKAKAATDLLFRHIQDPTAPSENVTLDVHLVSRESVSCRHRDGHGPMPVS